MDCCDISTTRNPLDGLHYCDGCGNPVNVPGTPYNAYIAGRCARDPEIADLKRQLESLQDAWRELRREHGKTVGGLNESRAHAEALAGALATANCPYPVIDDPTIQACVEAGECGCDSGNAYRNREE